MSRRAGLVRELARRRPPADELSPLTATFLRGLSLGALIGAAIAGATMVRRDREASVGRQAPASGGRAGSTDVSTPGE